MIRKQLSIQDKKKPGKNIIKGKVIKEIQKSWIFIKISGKLYLIYRRLIYTICRLKYKRKIS